MITFTVALEHFIPWKKGHYQNNYDMLCVTPVLLACIVVYMIVRNIVGSVTNQVQTVRSSI